jgi:thiosulfate/3-mercaptopyruvate sulfurtransferase
MGQDWNPASFLTGNTSGNTEPSAVQELSSSDSQRILAPLSSVPSYDVVLDVSDGADMYIPGSVHIDYMDFLDGQHLKPVPEIAELLGSQGISRDDSILVYGKCRTCNQSTNARLAASTFSFWVLRSLGQDNVAMLDGGVEDWIAAYGSFNASPITRPAKNYTPVLRPELTASYEYVRNYVRSGRAQVVDARRPESHLYDRIPTSINVPYKEIQDDDRMKDKAALESLFFKLSKLRPVVVYSDTGVVGSMVWYALELAGYNASLYSFEDWFLNRPALEIDLKSVRAEPNPASSGSAVNIVAVFGPAGQNASINEADASSSSDSSKDIRLTIKGCVNCEGEAFIHQSLPYKGESSQVLKLGSSKSPEGRSFSCAAIIQDSNHTPVARVDMKQVLGEEYAGTWRANVEPGIYNVTIVASEVEAVKFFKNALRLEIKENLATSRYKKLGNY